ncbi:kallikrein-14-like, partial [Cyanistes caeruleus]|uniref:kallikrein-14-like n=1 Tax=Cyanistes caeruleus TaxID=156563 RepID=UPI000CDB63E5
VTTVALGKHLLYGREAGDERRMVARMVAHPGYDPTTKDNDIMLLKLLTPATISDRVRPIPVASCLPRAGTSCLTSGWGATTSPEVTYPEVLQCVNVTVVTVVVTVVVPVVTVVTVVTVVVTLVTVVNVLS